MEDNTKNYTGGETRCGYVALIGAPNAGKSTLLNRIVGGKIAIVTPKVQTTRSRILGMVVHNHAQCIFVDTPGIFNARKRFEKAMVRSALDGARDADIICLIVDSAKGICDNTRRIVAEIKDSSQEKILVLNKVDITDKEKLLSLSEELFRLCDFTKVFMISAEKNKGIDDFMNYIADSLPPSPYLYPEDMMTDIPMRQLAAEITREKIFLRLREELPYDIAVETEEWEEREDGSIKISQVIYVRSKGQKKILLGKNGSMAKSIGKAARIELCHLTGRKIHLFTFVKVAENWKENKEFYKAIGLEFK